MLDKVNKVVKLMVFSDLMLFSGWGFIMPVFSIFVIEEIYEATLVTAGIATAVYWLLRGLVQPSVAKFIDRTKGEKDDFWVLVGSLAIVGIASGSLAFVETKTALYVVQMVHGAAFGAYSVAWPAIFSRHMDKGGVAFDWALDRGSVGLSVALTSILGAKGAELLGFDLIFVLAGLTALVSAAILLGIPKLILPKPQKSHPTSREIGLHRKHKGRNPIGF